MKRGLIQRRHDAEQLQLANRRAGLRPVLPRLPRTSDFGQAMEDVAQGFCDQTLRDPAAWRPNLKTRDPGRLRLAAARHLYARYPVPPLLEHIWLDDAGLPDDERWLRRQWYVTAARGGSLQPLGAALGLTRREVHAVLHASAGLDFNQACWEAVARSHTGDPALALRIARSKVGRAPHGEMAFWRGVVRFFCAQPASMETINDLCDYLGDRHQTDPQFTLEGRTLRALQRQMHRWHRTLALIARAEALRRSYDEDGRYLGYADLSWPGLPLADWVCTPQDDAAADGASYLVRQLKRASELVQEGEAQQHCVASYADLCERGEASIWSLRRIDASGVKRLLTIELDERRHIVQVRGCANRSATAEELALLERWARARGLQWV